MVDIGFVQLLAVDEYLALLHLHSVTANCDNALDKVTGLVLGEAENYDFALLRVGNKVAQLINDKTLMVYQSRIHRGAFYHIRLYQKGADAECQCYRNNNRNKPITGRILPGGFTFLAQLMSLLSIAAQAGFLTTII